MIQSLEIKNFKSIKEVKTAFPQLLAAIVGKNAAGKTNLLQSIAVLKELVAGDQIDAVFAKLVSVPAEVFNKDSSEKVLTMSIELSDKDEARYFFQVSIKLINGNVPANFVITYEKLEVQRDGNKILVYERKETQIEDNNRTAILIATDPKKLVVSLYPNKDAQIVREIFLGIQIPDAQLIDSRETIVGAREKNLSGLLIQLRHNQPDLFSEFEKIAKKLLPAFSSITELATPKAENPTAAPSTEELFVVLFEEKNLQGKLSIKLFSAGDIRTLYIIAIAVSMAGHTTLILEEIENGIHQKRIEQIIDHLQTISRVKNIQIIFTTHSERVINRLAAQEILYVEKDPLNLSKGTSITNLTDAGGIERIKEVLNKGGNLSEYVNINFSK